MTDPDTPQSPDPYRDAVRSVLAADLSAELASAEAAYQTGLTEAQAARGRAEDHMRHHFLGRPFEHLEAELEREHNELIAYHTVRFAKRIRWVLQAWKDTPDE